MENPSLLDLDEFGALEKFLSDVGLLGEAHPDALLDMPEFDTEVRRPARGSGCRSSQNLQPPEDWQPDAACAVPTPKILTGRPVPHGRYGLERGGGPWPQRQASSEC